MGNLILLKCRKLKVLGLIVLLLFILNNTSAQVVEEVVQIDTTFETINVIYKPVSNSSYYFKKIAVFADDTTQVAVEKSYTSNGQNGLYKVYYPSGRLKIKTVFANNKIYGEWTYYDREGVIITKGLYKDGVKHGYWAYKSLRTYGRYRKGEKHKRWKRYDENEDKYISHYEKGVLQSGEGIGHLVPSYLKSPEIKRSLLSTIGVVNKKGKKNKENAVGDKAEELVVVDVKGATGISREYEQAISFLMRNVMFRKALKNYLGTSMKKSVAIKKCFDKMQRFQFVISPKVKALSLSTFIEENEADKIEVESIRTIIKEKKVELEKMFSGELVEKNSNLFENSTDKESSMEVVFSDVKLNLMRLDINWTFKDELSKFQLLLYFDDNGVLKGAEYQKP